MELAMSACRTVAISGTAFRPKVWTRLSLCDILWSDHSAPSSMHWSCETIPVADMDISAVAKALKETPLSADILEFKFAHVPSFFTFKFLRQLIPSFLPPQWVWSSMQRQGSTELSARAASFFCLSWSCLQLYSSPVVLLRMRQNRKQNLLSTYTKPCTFTSTSM